MHKSYLKDTVSDRIFLGVVIFVLIIITLIIIYPLIFVVMASFSNPLEVYQNPLLLWPRGFNVYNYVEVLMEPNIWRGYLNSIFYTIAATFVGIVLTTFAAYPLSRKDFYGRNFFTFIFVFTMFFSGGLIPTFLVIRTLGMLNTIWAVIIPGSVSVFNIVIMRTYFQSQIPLEIQEAAAIDGCNNIRILFNVVLPLSMPIIMVLVLFYGATQWNAYFGAMMFLTDHSLFPLQLVLRDFLILNQLDNLLTAVIDEGHFERLIAREGMKFAIVVVSSVPLLALYPFLQKFFEKGILVGALKG